MNRRETVASLRARYRFTGLVYDILDVPWERIYRRWRPQLVGDLAGTILEAGVGTGRNLPFYRGQRVVGLDLSEVMLARASRRLPADARAHLLQGDACRLPMSSASVDSYLSTFLYCVLPDDLQTGSLAEMARVLKPGGRFRLLEIIYSRNERKRRQQEFLAPVVERLYGARFDRRTLDLIRSTPVLEVTSTRFLKDDTYLLIDGVRR